MGLSVQSNVSTRLISDVYLDNNVDKTCYLHKTFLFFKVILTSIEILWIA